LATIKCSKPNYSCGSWNKSPYWWEWNIWLIWCGASSFEQNMWQEVVKMIKPFVEFLKAFESHQVNNMLALMLDFHFESLCIMENFVGFWKCNLLHC
jgi:hypothetical protein